MGVIKQTRRGLSSVSVATFALVACLRCSVYDSSLLGVAELEVGGAATGDHAGASGAAPATSDAGRSASAGGSEIDNGGLGGFIDAAGAIDSGGTETAGGTAGKIGTGSVGGKSGMGGAAGKANTGGVTGAAGASGTNGGTVGSVAGNAGNSSGGGAGGASQTASGCAKLLVPLDDSANKAHFVISLASPVDLSAATISMRFYVQAGKGGTIFNYVQDSGTFHFLGVATAKRQLLSGVSGWSTISWDVGAEPDPGTGIVKTSIKSIGIEINAQPSSAWSNPTIVYVDSITVTSPALSFMFDAANSVSSSNTSGALWLNGGPSDTTADNVALSWQATCP